MAGQHFAQYLPHGEQPGAETRHGQQLFRRSVQHAADIVETQQQFPGQRFGILARLPVAQQQFQDLIIGHGQRLASQSLTQAAAVAAMGRGRGYRHCGHKVRCFLASARGRKEIHWGEPSSLLAMPVKLLRR